MDYLKLIESSDNKTVVIELEKSLYSKATILKTCYKFTDNSYIYINTFKIDDNEYFRIYLQKKDNTFDLDLNGEFMNELLDQELRGIVFNETKKIRETIVTRALLSGQTNDNRI